MKKALLLGDSIRMGYQGYVREALKGRMNVVGPEENCRFTKYTLWGVNHWVKELGKPDIIHWNNGLWDLHQEAPMEEELTLIDEYLENLNRIIHELRRTGAPIIFATTTPVPEDAVGRSNKVIDMYNNAASELMRKNAIEINDLNQLIKQNKEAYISEDKLHLTDLGYRKCAEQVCNMLQKTLRG